MTQTPYAWMGGQAALERLTEVFYRQVHKDHLLAPVFAHASPEHPHLVAVWLAEVFGGPAEYSAQHGGHAHMATMHKGRGVTEEQRRRWVELLMDAADEAELPNDPEFRAVFAYYIEWGTRMALVYSGPNPPPASANVPVPKWGWNQTPPWEPAG